MFSSFIVDLIPKGGRNNPIFLYEVWDEGENNILHIYQAFLLKDPKAFIGLQVWQFAAQDGSWVDMAWDSLQDQGVELVCLTFINQPPGKGCKMIILCFIFPGDKAFC